MANQAAFESGYQQGYDVLAQNRAHKQMMSDEERQSKAQLYASNLTNLQQKISSLPKGSPEYNDAFNEMQNNLHGVRELFHPDKNPGMIERYGHLITDALRITNPQDRIKKEAAKRAQGVAGDEKQAQSIVAAAPLSPEQLSLQQVQAKVREIDSSDLSDEDKAEAKRKIFGVSEKPNLKLYVSPDGSTKAWLDANRTDSIPVGWTAYTATNTDTNKRKDFDAFKTDYEAKNGKPYAGTFESWTAEQGETGRAQAPKPETLDTQYKAILVKEASGQPLTADEQAHKAAWQIYNRETKIDPGVARAAAFGAMRYIPIIDLNNPEKVVMMRAGDAAKAGASTPQSIGFKTDAAITRYMTSGQGATNINYFNTATGHLELLRQAGEALNNGDYPAFNSFANRFATATGDPAPTNFDTVKSAVAGELSKTFKGTGATDQEIAEISTTLNNAQSPQQIVGAITYYTKLMGEKLDALKGQYEAGKTGKPNFPTPPPGLGDGTTPQGGGNATPKPKKRISIKMAMMLPENKGKTEAEVTKHLTDSGYTPVKP